MFRQYLLQQRTEIPIRMVQIEPKIIAIGGGSYIRDSNLECRLKER